MTIVIDASTVVAALVDRGATGQWAVQQLRANSLAAPHLMPAEVTNMLRRAVSSSSLTPEAGSSAHESLGGMRARLVPYRRVASRVWALREAVTAYDAWYVAVAEMLGAPLVTLDLRLTRAPGPRCEFRTPVDP